MFQKLRGYDAPLLIKQLGKKFNRDDVAENKKYIIFNVKINVRAPDLSNNDGKYAKVFSLASQTGAGLYYLA